MSTDRIATADLTWNDEPEAGTPARGWLARLGAAIGRLFGRRPGLRVLEPTLDDGPVPPGARAAGKHGTTARGRVVERTRPIDARDIVEAVPAPRARTEVQHPPPVPARVTQSHRALAASALGDEYDPLDDLITMLQAVGDVALPPPPTDEQLAWLDLLAPLIEYELMARGSTALSFQSTAAQLGELIALRDTDLNGAVRVVSRAPAVAVAVLSAANSAAHRRGGDVGDIRTAIARLGLAETRRIGIATATRAIHDPEGPPLAAHHRARGQRDLHRAMTCAFASAALAARSPTLPGEDPFVAGMFFDLGRPLVHRAVIALETRQRVQPVPAAMLDMVIERTHAAVGAEALTAWGLPARLGELALHHLSAAPPVTMVGPDLHRLALVSTLVLARSGSPVPLGAGRRATAALGLERAELRRLALEVAELGERVTELFGVRDGATTWGGPPLA